MTVRHLFSMCAVSHTLKIIEVIVIIISHFVRKCNEFYLCNHSDDAEHGDPHPERGHEDCRQLLPRPGRRLGLELHVAERRKHEGERYGRYGSLEFGGKVSQSSNPTNVNLFSYVKLQHYPQAVCGEGDCGDGGHDGQRQDDVNGLAIRIVLSGCLLPQEGVGDDLPGDEALERIGEEDGEGEEDAGDGHEVVRKAT